jgi:hypothetical protein
MPIAPVAAALPPSAVTPAAPQGQGFAARLEARGAAPAPRAAAAPQPHPAAVALGQLDRAQARLDAVLAAARAGRTFTAAELLGLQAEAYRCAQTVDLASKLVDQGAQAVKQALNTQL